MAGNGNENVNGNGNGKAPFPAWLRELCYFGGIIAGMTIFLLSMKSDLRSTSEKLDTFSQRLATIEQRLPNREADALKFGVLEAKVDANHEYLNYEMEKLKKWKEETSNVLLKKGIL